jgi:metal iron transporter
LGHSQLLGFAILINSSILILAGAVFYYGDGKTSAPDGISDLFDAFDLVEQYIGRAFALLFAIGLLASGQAASLTVTLSGQIVGEGFIAWQTVPWKRRLITRLIGIVPSLAVSLAVGRSGIDDLLVGSQVALSIVLTFVTIP